MKQNQYVYKIPVFFSLFVIIGTLFFYLSTSKGAQSVKLSEPATMQQEVSSEEPDNQTESGNADAWTGIDVSIVGKYAKEYGHPPRDPYINTDQGDLLLFVFTLSGVIGGFIMGFNARKIFYENKQ